jgi:gliding motility-associated-like protein
MNDGNTPFTIYLDGEIAYSNVTVRFQLIGSVNPGTYVVGVEDGTGRYSDTTVTVNSPPPMGFQKSLTQVSCREYNIDGSSPSDGGIEYHAEGGAGSYVYTWADTSDPDSIRQDLPVGIYRLTITDANGCDMTDSTIITARDTIDARIYLSYEDIEDVNGVLHPVEMGKYPSTLNDSLCYLSNWQLFAWHNYNTVEYEWIPDTLLDDPANYISQEVTFTMRQDSRFVLIIRNEDCLDYDTITLLMRDTIGIEITTDEYRIADSIYTLPGEPISLFSSDGFFEYLWNANGEFDDINAQDPVYTPFDTVEVVVVRGTNFSSCYEQDTVYTRIRQLVNEVYDVFTPNGDEFNQYWVIPNAAQYPDLEVTIFNRWGQQVFYSSPYGTDMHHTWDGTAQKSGKDLPIGTYYYIIKPNDGEQEPITGTVTIVR